jgi:NDP-sugar pyrophosphorylase family protein
VAALARVGVTRVIVGCAVGNEALFHDQLGGIGPEVVTAPEPEPLGRGGGLRFASGFRKEQGPLYALNGDELIALDFRALLDDHLARRPAATITVTPMPSSFGVVDVDESDVVKGFSEAPRLPFWVNCGVYVLDDEALARLPERGDHETTTFPELALEGRLNAFRYEDLWITVNTPKDLRRAEEYVSEHPDWLTATST